MPIAADAMSRQVRLLLKVGAEGGYLVICGSSDATEGKRYRFGLVDDTLQMLGEEEGGTTIRRDSGWLDSWDAAIKALSVYPWPHLFPLFVAPQVSAAVWGVLQERSAAAAGEGREIDLDKWRRVIRESLGVLPGHPLAAPIIEGIGDPVFAAAWQDEVDTTFRPLVAAILVIRQAVNMPAQERFALMRQLCRKNRVTILSEVLGTRIPQRVLQWSSRTAWEDFSLADWTQFFEIVLAEDRHSAIAGVRSITRTLLEQFRLIPEALRRKGLLNIASQLEVPAHRWKSLAVNFAKVDEGMRPGLLRKAATMEHRGEFWDLYFRCEGQYWRPFRLPASLPPSDVLEPIMSPLDMDAEGLVMKNCLSTLSSRVLNGDRIYFRMRGKSDVNAELVHQSSGWVPGRILGPQNAPIPEDAAIPIRNELLRLGHAITDGAAHSKLTDEFLEKLRQKAREVFGAREIDAVTKHLAAIQGRSLPSPNGAYVIFSMRRGGFVQFMDSHGTEEYLCEVQSYKFQMEFGEYLDANAVDLIEKAGFVWPTSKENFIRWFKSDCPANLRRIAEFTLAALHSLFGCRSVNDFDVKCHIPEGAPESGLTRSRSETIVKSRDDKFLMPEVPITHPICHRCRYWNRDLTCQAFPEGIPLGILTNEWDHRYRVDGDHGLVYTPMDIAGGEPK